MSTLTRGQALTTIYGWGYAAGNLPRKSETGADTVALSAPGGKRVMVTLGLKDRSGRQLYNFAPIDAEEAK